MTRQVILLLFCMLLVVAGPAVAEETQSTPEPANLSADWWNYFATEPALDKEQMEKRMSSFKDALTAMLNNLDPARRLELEPQVTRSTELLDRYLERLDEAPAPLPAIVPVADTYSLEEGLTRHREWRKLRLETTSLREETEWQKELISAERGQHSRRKVSFLELETSSPKYIEMALDLIVSRLQLELKVLDLKQVTRKLARLNENLEALTRELSEIAPRLTATAEEAKVWEGRRQAAIDKASELRAEIDTNNETGTPLAQPDTDPMAARIAALNTIELGVQAAEQDLLAQTALLSAEILRIVAADNAPLAKAKEALRESDRLLKSLEPQKGYWKRAAERVRASAANQDAAISDEEDRASLQASVEAITQTLVRVEQQADTLRFLDDLLDERVRMREGTLKRGFAHVKDTLMFSWQGAQELFTASLFEVNETPVTLLGLVRVLIIITVAFLLSKALRRTMERIAARRTGVSHSSFYTLGRVVHYFVLGIGIVIALSSIGIDFTKFALLASALGIGIGFGMQTLVSNFVAGLIILFEKSLKVGDFVELESGVTGEVKEVNMRSTLVTTNDNVDILVPNSEFINKAVTNWTLREAARRIHVPFGVAYGTDKDLVKKAVLEAADLVPWTLKGQKRREPQVWFVNFGASSLDFELVVWLTRDAVKRPSSVHAHYLWEIESKLKEYDIEIPFPQQDLHLRSGFEALRA